MRSVLKQIIAKNKQEERDLRLARQAEIENPKTADDRRSFLKKTALGGIAMTGMMGLGIEDTIAQTTSKVSRMSAPSELKITDMRYALTNVMGGTAIIKIETNQGIYGLGEVRDAADVRYALFLKSRILGKNPCNVEKIFKSIKQFGGPARQAGGVCAVEMALWDICGKAYNVPAWQLLGGRYRDKVRLYADTPEASSPEEQKRLIDFRVNEQGYTWLKMDVSIGELRGKPGTVVNGKFWENDKGVLAQWGDRRNMMSYGNTMHPFTQIQITEKGLEVLQQVVEDVRNMVGYEIPISTDHYGHFDLNNGIRLAKALDKYRLAWFEDMVPWQYNEQWKIITEAIETPTTTGEDIYLLKDFMPLIQNRAVDIVHPDLASSGGLLETKRIGDYAEEFGIAMAMHQAGTPVSFMANVHCAAATQNFLALEHHSVDVPWWESLVKTVGGFKMIDKGFATVPLTAPGLGIELDEEVVKAHLHQSDKTFFKSTEEWNELRSHDRTYS
ncbi:MAG TPA: mandelate racemase/muconate lactonizing enzyme family protein [Muricauda sp.]|uniref:Mandelate racemase/muconate lactonizing enzyme family protein n=1 Tax=Flagellimonas aurea TaxID=2915619 RepID=A0ABS3G5R6_9FLAO|nr:mandelate racemase/muconate lactonizing enzyme family protein [Allomuricauda aurea]MAO18675.1 mandelate racemase [Allomuricauda sp.]MBO0354749.1 mandelate racemase/muconate lactonizing enzyme family protein [Allomuricauda aurea]HBU79487.1 mandelate racemase/muconate lactonizing enzyme family protein [Allomuricauda sp.]|tara:strand:- start:5205 stop:6704 length:1500 start_codon:yes stop_codon:yes gene_type:complete